MTLHSQIINMSLEETNEELSFIDIITNKYGNYVIQAAFDKSNPDQRLMILRKIKLTLYKV